MIIETADSRVESRGSQPPADFDSQAARHAATEAFRQARPEIDALIAAMPQSRARLMAAMAACWLEISHWSAGCRAFGLRRRFIVASGPAAGMCELAGPGCGDECPFPSAAAQARVHRRRGGIEKSSEVKKS